MEFLIVSGLSGGGKSRAADVLEDLDFYCVDNMPTALLTKFAELCLATRGRYEKVALVTDIRSQESFSELFAALGELTEHGRALPHSVRRGVGERHRAPLQGVAPAAPAAGRERLLPARGRAPRERAARPRARARRLSSSTRRASRSPMLQKRICEYLCRRRHAARHSRQRRVLRLQVRHPDRRRPRVRRALSAEPVLRRKAPAP